MQLFDAITEEERETILHYIQLYAGVSKPAPLSQVFQEWNKQKKTLFKALGEKLRVSFPVEIPKNTLYYQHELKAIYDVYPIWDERDAQYFLDHISEMKNRIHNDFIFEYLKFISQADWPDLDKHQASRLILHQNIEKEYLSSVKRYYDDSDEYRFQSFKATIKNNMRTIKVIQKILKIIKFPYMDLFEKWRNQISDININKDIKANLVISIHPLDFMTLSDNNCDWSSCMSWISDGSYSAGTIEMMNSNMAVVCYLESKTPFSICFDEQNFYIPNKSWRSLLYVNKHILVAGKAYPYYNENLSKCCLDIMRGLLKENLNWDYQYINQPYLDNNSIKNNFFLKKNSLQQFDRPINKKKKKHAIYLYTNCMYNDLVEYSDTTYWCCRNYVPKTLKLCVSGLATCMCCGDRIEDPADINSYEDVGSEKVCWDCRSNRRCFSCGKIIYDNTKYNIRGKRICSDACLQDLIYVPTLDQIYHKDSLKDRDICIIGKEKDFIFSEKAKALQNKFKQYWCWNFETTLEDLKNDTMLQKVAIIVTVPHFILSKYSIHYTYVKDKGWKTRPSIRDYAKLFEKNEIIENTNKTILEIIQENTQWIPAKEVINENSGSLTL